MTMSMFDAAAPRRWPLAAQMGVLFGAAITLTLAGVSVLMYAELVNELRTRETTELRFDLKMQQAVLAAAAARRHVDDWQREWQESSNAYRRFAWQVVGADGTVRAASSNWPAFARATAGGTRQPGAGAPFADPGGARPAGPQRVLTDKVGLDRLVDRRAAGAGSGDVLHGALDISRDVLVLQDYRDRLLGTCALATLLALALAWPLARYGVAPLAMLARTVGRAERDHLDALPGSARWPAELRQMAAAFDDMLAALARSHGRLALVSADLARELCGPIGNVLTASSVTLARTRDAGQYRQALGVVVEEGNRLSRVLSSILFVVRADSGAQAVARQRLSLAAEFGTLAEFFEAAFQDRGVTLAAAGAGDVEADPQLLRRALSILLAEALRHAHDGDAVRLAGHAGCDEAVIAVEIAGAGLPGAQLAFLAAPFDAARPAGAAGDWAGIDLAVVRAIVMLHGGAVVAAGQPGQGTRIEMHFPCAPVCRPQQPGSR